MTTIIRCWEFKLKLEKKTIKTFVYSDNGKDIEARFPNMTVSDIKEIDDPVAQNPKKKDE